jgi:hypothetical protein
MSETMSPLLDNNGSKEESPRPSPGAFNAIVASSQLADSILGEVQN